MNGSKNGKHLVYPIATLSALDELIGDRIMQEEPEICWQDIHGVFSFESELEARSALQDPYYQRFLPDVDWSETVIQRVKTYRPYTSDLDLAWLAVEKLVPSCGPLQISRHAGLWTACFRNGQGGNSRNICIAICLAALEVNGYQVELDADRLA
jgi:hypothetical protein